MRIVDEELKEIMQEYYILHDIRKASDKIKKEKTSLTKEQIRERNRNRAKKRIEREQRKFLQQQVKFINSPNYKLIQNENRRSKTESIKKTPQKKVRRNVANEIHYEKYSGIMPGGDSGRKFRDCDWNDDIARNFKKELSEVRRYRVINGLYNKDRGALK